MWQWILLQFDLDLDLELILPSSKRSSIDGSLARSLNGIDSGIGPGDHLKSVGISNVLVDNPEVGNGLRDKSALSGRESKSHVKAQHTTDE